MDYVNGIKEFIDHSPVNFFAIRNAEELLIKEGYKRVFENEPLNIKLGDKFYIKRMDLSLIAFNVGKESDKNGHPLHIIASHVDSPCFKLKPIFDSSNQYYGRLNVEPYGGMIMSSWMDRPLSIAGRIVVKRNEEIVNEFINIDKDLLIMPNLCIHFNREVNNAYAFNAQVDTQPIYGLEGNDEAIFKLICEELKINKEDILGHDLYLYNRDQMRLLGLNNDFICSPRLDDLECVYTSLMAFLDSNSNKAINVLYLANNEEVGSSSSTGVDSDFLYTSLLRLSKSLEFDLSNCISNSFLVSADNAHAIHPNKMEAYDSNNRVEMNKGLALKFNAANRYTSDGLSSALFTEILKNNNLPYQYFTNRSDIRGGSTLGNILLNHVSILSIDVGLGQLAMHSSFETAGVKDVEYAVNSFKAFYNASIIMDGDNYKVIC